VPQRLDQIRAGLRARSAKARADTARSTNPQGVHLTGPSTSFRNPEPDPKEKRGWGRMFLDTLNPFSDFNKGIRRGAVRGVIGAISETTDIAVTLGGAAADITGLGEKYGGEDFLDWWAQDDDDRNPAHISKDVIDNVVGFRGPDTVVGSLVEGITQFSVGMLGAGKFLKLANTGTVAKGFIRGAAADVVVFDANEDRLGNMLANGPQWLRNPLTEFIGGITAAKETDNELIGKFKNALEGVMLGGLVVGFGKGVAAIVRRVQGDTQGARILAREFTADEVKGVVELPNGKARLSLNPEDTKPFLKDTGDSPQGALEVFEGLDTSAIDGDPLRRFEFAGRNGETGAMDVKMSERTLPDGEVVQDVLIVDRMGRLEADGSINVDPESGFRIEEGGMPKMAAELRAEFPAANVADGLHLRSFTRKFEATGAAKPIELARFKQEVFASPGEAHIEAVSMASMRLQNAVPLNRMSKEVFGDMDTLVEAYRTNRSGRTIRKMERQLVANMRTNMGAGRQDVVGLIEDIAKRLSRAGGGSAKVMRSNADKSLEMLKGTPLEGIIKHPELAGITDELFVRRAAGLVMESLGDDIARYSIRINQGGSNLSVLQLGRALDQMVHVEEALTGRPAVWLDKHRKLYGEGKVSADPHGRKPNIDAEAGPPEIDPENALARRAQEGAEDVAKPVQPDEGTVRTLSQGADGEIKVDGVPAAEAAVPAGVAPGPASLRNMSKAEILEVGRWVALADGDPRAILTALKGLRIEALAAAGNPGMKQALLRWRLSAMLSGVSTQMVNVVSTAIQSVLLPTELLVGGALTGQPKFMREAAGIYMGLLMEGGDAMRASIRAFKAGKGALDPGFMTRELDAGRFTGFMAAANLPQDFLTSADEFFKVLNYRAKIRGKSLRQSAAAGLDSDQMAKRMVDDLEASISADGAALNTEALEYSRNATFTDELSGSAARLSGFLHADDTNLGTVGKLFVPFIRTPHNIMRNIVLRTPLAQNLMQSHNRALLAGGAEGAAAAGRMATAGAMAGMAGVLVSGGRITGRGPLHPDVRKAWLAAGFVPYTIQFNDNIKINYNRLSSLFGPLAMMADLNYVTGNLDPDEALEGAATVAASLLSYVSDQGFVGNMSEMFDTIISGDAHSMQTFVESVAIGMAVPQALSQFTGWDDTMREADGFMDELYAKTPGLSDRLPPQRNIFREPVMKAPGSMDRTFNPFTQVGPTDNETALALFRVGRQMALPGHKKFDGRIDLKDTERWGEVDGMSPYEFWMEQSAKGRFSRTTLKQDLTRLVKSSEWKRAPEGSEDWPGGPRFVKAARIVKRRQDAGERAMLRAFPSIRRALLQERMLKRFGDLGGRPATDRLQRSFRKRSR